MASEEKNNTPELDEDVSFFRPTARQATLFSPRAKLGTFFALTTGVLVYFALTAFGGATVEFNKVADVAAAGPTSEDHTVGVIGKLVEDSYLRSADGVTANFSLVDEDGSTHMQIAYAGEIGQVFFNDHSEIMLKGHLGADQVFQADTLTVRCPSKYLTEQERAEIEAYNNGEPLPQEKDYFTNTAG